MKIDLEKILKVRIEGLNRQINEEIIAKDSSPTPTQSHSDKTRQVAEQMIDSLYQEKKNLTNLQKELLGFPKYTQLASLNTFVTIRSKVGEKTYLLVPEGLGGIVVNKVFLLSVESPFAIKFINQKIGHSFEINDSLWSITSIKPN